MSSRLDYRSRLGSIAFTVRITDNDYEWISPDYTVTIRAVPITDYDWPRPLIKNPGLLSATPVSLFLQFTRNRRSGETGAAQGSPRKGASEQSEISLDWFLLVFL